jgi:hypothetical protein
VGANSRHVFRVSSGGVAAASVEGFSEERESVEDLLSAADVVVVVVARDVNVDLVDADL